MDHDTRSVRASYGPVTRVHLRDAIAERIRDMIRAGELKPGDRLPPERELARAFGCSRAAVREAIRILEHAGLVQVEHGVGAAVTDWALSALYGLTMQTLVQEAHRLEQVLELRKMLEVPVAGLAAVRRDEGELARLEAILATMAEAASRGEPAIEEDFEFHLQIARCARNDAVVKVMGAISGLVRHALSLHRIKTWNIPGRPQQVVEQHRRIVEAIRARDPAAAEAAMREHLESVEQLLFPKAAQGGEAASPTGAGAAAGG